jgi:hypothetical protein
LKTSGGPLATVHGGFANVLLIYSAAVAVWALILYFRGRNPSGGLLGALLIAEGIAILQSLLGLGLLAQGHRPDDPLHYLYGVVAVLTFPTAYLWGAGGREHRDSLIFALAAIFLVGITIRAVTTG